MDHVILEIKFALIAHMCSSVWLYDWHVWLICMYVCMWCDATLDACLLSDWALLPLVLPRPIADLHPSLHHHHIHLLIYPTTIGNRKTMSDANEKKMALSNLQQPRQLWLLRHPWQPAWQPVHHQSHHQQHPRPVFPLRTLIISSEGLFTFCVY